MQPRSLKACFELALPADEMLLSISLDAWIRSYTVDPTASIVELSNFLVFASGLEKVHLDLLSVTHDGQEDPLDALLTEQNCQDLVDEANERKAYREPYPLAEKKGAAHKRYRQLLTQLYTSLLDKVKHEILYDDVLLPWLVEWLTIVTQSGHRGLRHTGTELAMGVMVHLCELQAELLLSLIHI